MDKNQAVIDYLRNCPQLANNPLFFNFGEAKDNNKQILIDATDRRLNTGFIDGSVLKRYIFTIIDFRSVNNQALATGKSSENVEEMLDVQGIIDWIDKQNDVRNYPDFGTDCIIENIASQTDNPRLNGVDTNLKPALAKYHISIVIDYVDKSKTIWNKEE